ncbi:Uncharacterised protein [Citrobacter koseri]|nr:Uncharacterised protein [Citrobacter koseri]
MRSTAMRAISASLLMNVMSLNACGARPADSATRTWSPMS